ncbi:hypothetical protein DV738_g2987, partial [Chaetothyriales sp. CBS 135597]
MDWDSFRPPGQPHQGLENQEEPGYYQSHGHEVLHRPPAPLVYEGFVPGNDHGHRHAELFDPVQHVEGGEATIEAADDLVNDALLAAAGRRGRARKSRGKSKAAPKGSGRRGGWCKGMKLGPRPVIEASPRFNELYAEAVRCIIAQPPDPQKAIELITEAIALNPEQHRAHPVLAEAHHQLGNDQTAIDVLFIGAHANPYDPEAWQDVVQRCLDWTGIGRKAALEKAVVGCSELLKIDNDDYEARFQRAAIYREQGKLGRCINELNKVLSAFPYNSSAMEEYAKACIELNKIPAAIDLYKEAIEYYLELGLGNPEDTFEWSDVCAYVDLVARNGRYTDTLPVAIKVLKKLSRWLLGRQAETFWDACSLEHDAEFDIEDEPRRISLPEYIPGRFPLEAYGLGLPLELRAQLGILRLRHGDRTEALNHVEWLLDKGHDGNEDHIQNFPHLFLQVAIALSDTKEHAEALRFYEQIQRAGAIDTHTFWVGIGHSSFVCNKKEQALDCFKRALNCDAESIEAKTWIAKILIEKGATLEAIDIARDAAETAQSRVPQKADTRVYERKESRLLREEAERTLRYAEKLVAPKVKKRYRKRKEIDEDDAEAGTSGKRRRRREHRGPRPLKVSRLPDEDDAGRHERVMQYYTTMLNNTEAMRSDDMVARGIWIDCAASLLDDLRSNKAFFPKALGKASEGLNADLIRAAIRLQGTPANPLYRSSTPHDDGCGPVSNLPTAYRTIPLTTWLDIILEYTLLLSRSSPSAPLSPINRRLCYEAINTALTCPLFTHHPTAVPDGSFRIQLCHLVCALAFRDEKLLFNNILRWFMREHPLCTDAYRLLGAINLYFPYFSPPIHTGGKEGIVQKSVFRSPNAAKAMRRHIYALDKALIDDYLDPSEGPVPEFMRREREETFTALESVEGIDPVTGALTTTKVPIRVQEMDVVLLMLYGQILYATGSFMSALNYFSRARAVDPENPLVLLSIALCYLHQAMRRAEGKDGTRHGLVLMGWAMMSEYEEKRLAWAERQTKSQSDEEMTGDEDMQRQQGKQDDLMEAVRREITFNRARCWNMLGCAGLAKAEYEKLLVQQPDFLDPRLQPKTPSLNATTTPTDGGSSNKGLWTMEAAYAVANLCLAAGDTEGARAVTERYLVVE